MKIISFIVPFKNTEPSFIERLILSIKNQKTLNYQIIFIDDNSNINFDYSKFITNFNCEYYEYPIKEEFFHLGQLRDFGLQFAIGDYVWFVDSDDIIVDGAIEKIINFFEIYSDIDLVYFDYLDFKNINEIKIPSKKEHIYVNFDKNKWNKKISKYFLYKFQSDWRVCFKKDFLIQNNISHGDCKKKFEDIYYSIIYKNFLKKCVITNECFYLYDKSRNVSILNSLQEKERCLQRIEPIFDGINYLKSKNKLNENLYYFMNYYTSFFMHKKYNSFYERNLIYKNYIKKPYKYRSIKILGFSKKWLSNNVFIYLWILTGNILLLKAY